MQSFLNAVTQGDCLTLLPEMAPSSVDLVLTDPPYLTRYTSRDGRRVPNDDNEAWLKPAFAEIYRVLKPDRFCISFYGWPHADKFLAAFRQAGFRPVGHLVWPKPYSSAERFVRYQHEQAYLLAKGEPPKSAVLIPDVLDWQYTGNRLHPTQKPLCALLPLVQAFSYQNDIVLDPFCGSGSTLMAARLLGRQYIGFELDKNYSQLAQERLEQGREF